MGSTRSIEILCLALAALVLVWSRALADQPGPVLGLLAAFAVAIVAFRTRRFLPQRLRLRLAIESWTMIGFLTGVLWFTGKGSSPMYNLYLLPLILSALTLGRFVTMLQAAVICLAEVILAAVTPGIDVLSLAFAARAAGELAPIVLIAHLTTTLTADITEARERIENLAQTDPLTGLHNLRMFNELWRREHAAAEKAQGGYALLMIDIDGLKSINDKFGHEAGDGAIGLVAQCLRRSIRDTDHAARYGGDEFTVLLPGASPQSAEFVVKRMRNAVFKTTFEFRARMIRCNVSIGVSNFPADARDMRELLGVAERNMYRDKDLRRASGTEASV